MSDKAKTSNKPPYVAYKTFQNFVLSIRQAGVPDRIDRTVLPGLSGANQSFLISTLKFLGFINDEGVPTAEFIKLIKEPANEKAAFNKAAKAKYDFIFDGALNVESATEGQLLDKFRAFDLGGETVRKCLSFFVHLCNAAGIKLSPHIKGASGAGSNGTGTRRPYRKRKPQSEEIVNPPPPAELNQPKTIQQLLLEKFPAFDPKWDAETQKKWFDSFEKFMKVTENKSAEPK